MNIGNITSNNFNLDFNGKEMQIEVYEQLIKQLQQENKQLKDNWVKLKEYITEANEDLYWTNNYDDILYVMHELEQGSDSNE